MSNANEYFKKVAKKQATSIDRMLRRLHRDDARRADGGLFERSFDDYLKETESRDVEVEPVDESEGTAHIETETENVPVMTRKAFERVLPILKAFATLLEAHGFSDYTYLGSCALLAAGFPLMHDAHDVDVEILCDENGDAMFNKLKELNRRDGESVATSPEYEERKETKGRRAFFAFNFGGTTFNVWTKDVKEGFSDSQRFRADGLWFLGVGDVLQAKADYGRTKDKTDTHDVCLRLASMFGLDDEAFRAVDKLSARVPDHNTEKEERDGAQD